MTRNIFNRISAAVAMVAVSASTALAGPLPSATVERMIKTTQARISQLDARLVRINAAIEAENVEMSALAERSQRERMSADEYGDLLGDAFQQIAELSAERAGVEATKASLMTHLDSLRLQLPSENHGK